MLTRLLRTYPLHVFAVLLALVAALAIAPTFAANPHFVGRTTFVANPNGTVTATGTLAGLGNEDVTAVFNVTTTTTCTNPAGNVAPGQTKTTSTTIRNLHPENGRLNFNLTSATPTGGCPNPKWRATHTVTAATLTFFQGGQQVEQLTL